MLRRLIACLALLTGLAAAGTPVQAGFAENGLARIEAGLCEIAGEASEADLGATWSAGPVLRGPVLRTIRPRPLPWSQAPSIRIGIDRARE